MRRNILLMLVSALLSGGFLVRTFFQTTPTYYVSTTGSDSNDCLTPASACRSVSQAVTIATSGSDILVAQGVYTTTSAGTADAVIITKPLQIKGGWDETFSAVSGLSVLDGQYQFLPISVDSNATFDHVWVRNGRGLLGGNLSCLHDGAPIKVTFTNGAISSGSSIGYDGGGILLYSCHLDMSNSSVVYNTAVGENKWKDNAPLTGGGIFAYASSAGPITVRLRNVTIAYNTANGSGAGLATQGLVTLDMQNTLITDNQAPQKPDCVSAAATGNYNIVGALEECHLTGENNQATPPGLLTPFNPIWPFALPKAGHPAIDAGNLAGCLDFAGAPLLVDQRGLPRSDGRCDIGAVEYTAPGAAAHLFVIQGEGMHALPGQPFPHSLQARVTDGYGNLIENQSVDFTAPSTGPSAIFSDTQSSSASVLSNADGVADSGLLISNGMQGFFTVTASAPGLTDTLTFHLGTIIWYVSPSGSDSNTCLSPDQACASIGAVLQKSQFGDGDEIRVAEGRYTTTAYPMVSINRGVTIRGGWDANFQTQVSRSVLDGQKQTEPMEILGMGNVEVERLDLVNAYYSNLTIGRISTAPQVILREMNLTGSKRYGMNLAGGWVRAEGLTLENNWQGIELSSAGKMELHSSLVAHSTQASGITTSGVLTLTNSTISGNWGGGILLWGHGRLALFSVTIADNKLQGNGAGLRNGIETTVVMKNTIIANNRDTTYSNTPIYSDCSASNITSLGYNIIGKMNGCYFIPAASDHVNVPNLTLKPLANNGGNTLTHAFYADSPALDGGSPDGCAGALPAGVDQTGRSRVVDGNRDGRARCDIGAYEAQTLPEPGPATKTLFVSAAKGKIGNSCTTPLSPCRYIQDAIALAQSGDVIKIAGGVYTFIDKWDFYILGIIRDISVSGGWNETFTAQSAETILDGKQNKGGINVGIGIATIDNLTIINGESEYGSGINIEQGASAHISRVKITGCRAENHGGAVSINTYGSASISDSLIYNNFTSNYYHTSTGGGISMASWSNLIMERVTVDSNRSDSVGGGIFMDRGAFASIRGSTLTNNSAPVQGGGLMTLGVSYISSALFRGNSSKTGGAIYAQNNISNIQDSTFIQNTALELGGGVYGLFSCRRCAFIANEAASGGATAGSPYIESSTFHSNKAKFEGGAIYWNSETFTDNSLLNLTIVSNQAGGVGGGISSAYPNSADPVYLVNSVLWGNSAPSGPECYGKLGAGQYNWFGNLSACTIPSDPTNITGNPKLSLPAPGSLVPYLMPLQGSPLVDVAGATCAAPDQRGWLRPLDGNNDGVAACDVGAIEAGRGIFLPLIIK